MALAPCRECKKEISTEAAACPHCGVQKEKPLPWLRIVAGLAVVGFVAYCTNQVQQVARRAQVASSHISGGSDSGTCTTADFEVGKLKAYRLRNYAHLTGIVTNRCLQSAGVELKWTAYYEDGSVAFSETFWPNSITNIPSHSNFPFENMHEISAGKWKYDVVPVSVHVW